MKKLATLVTVIAVAALAACELQPAPPPPPPAPAAPAGSAAPTPAGSAAIIATGSAGSAAAAVPTPAPHPPPPPVDVTPECEQAGIKLAELMIEGAEDSQKPAFERDRANIVRRTEIVCTQQHWVPAALACIAQSKTDRDARACLEKFPSPQVQAAEAIGAGTGSAAGSAAPKERRPGGLDVHGAAGPKPKP